MRALVILVLAGGLLWLALQGFRSVRAEKESPPEPPRAGFILPPRESVTAEAPAAAPPQSNPTSAPAREPESAAGTASKETPAIAKAPEAVPTPSEALASKPELADPPPPARAAAPSTASPDELGAAGLILERPGEIPGFLQGPGRALAPERKQLALALHHLVLGSGAEVRRIADQFEPGDGVRIDEVEFLRSALDSPDLAYSGDSPMLRAASLSRAARAAEAHLAAGRSRDAALAYGAVLLGVLDAPWKSGREFLQACSDGLARAQRGYRWNPQADWPSIAVKVESGDSLISVRKRALESHPDLLVCTGEIARANGLRGEMIHPGELLRIPTAHPNVLVDLDQHWALYRLDAEVVAAWEIGIGKPGSETPPGEYRAGEKTKEPMWFRAGHPPVPFGDPENPLGTRWIAWQLLDGKNSSLGFHGTRDPQSIGDDQSQGCVRMRKEAIEDLFEILPRGAVIRVRG